MNNKRASLEVIAPTVDEALAKGLVDLGLDEDQVEVEVLDEGSRGLFGLRSRQARIRLTIKSMAEEFEMAVPSQPTETSSAPDAVQPQTVPAPAAPAPPPPAAELVEEEEEEGEPVGEDEATLRVARETVHELLEKMKVKAKVKPDSYPGGCERE
jgi:spoIIIJ-associated protein